jgi:hypothetical protein
MKKLFITLALACATLPALAQHHGHGFRHHGHHYRGGAGYGGWVAPLIIGGVIGYEINRANQQVIVQQPPVIVQSQPVLQQPPFGYHWEEMIDPATNTRKIVLVPN